MIRINFLLSIFLITLIFISSCDNQKQTKSLSRQDAEKLMSTYITTLKSGDTAAIKMFWSNKSLSRNGFDVMHLWVRGLIHISEWQEFLEKSGYDYKVSDLTEEVGYYIIGGNWIKPSGNSGENESHFI